MLRGLTLITLLFALSAGGADWYWTNQTGGYFSDASNWSGQVPNISDTASFTNQASYRVQFSGDAAVNSARFYRGVVTQEVASSVWLVTNRFEIGEGAGVQARVVQRTGRLAVTNSAGSGIIAVGPFNNGVFEIRGGEVTTDYLSADGPDSSKVNFTSGTLTLLHGGVLGGLFLGHDQTNGAVWNLLGGSTTIGNGGLLLGLPSSITGGNVLNMRGPTTRLSVRELDFAQTGPAGGQHRVSITGGAQLSTFQVQFGFNGGESNSVTIADPGSAWINDYYFFNSARGQTLTISNGGFFQTGGNTTYSDQQMEYGGPNNKLIVTGPGSRFRSEKVMKFGPQDCIGCSYGNSIDISNGGSFWAQSFSFVGGTTDTVSVRDGTFDTDSFSFQTGKFEVRAGTATAKQLSITGGTNAVLNCLGSFLVGHTGQLASGSFRFGGSNVVLTNLNGDLIGGDVVLGASPASVGQVRFNGTRAFITNTTGGSSVRIGDFGNGALTIATGYLHAGSIVLGRMPGSVGSLIIDGTTSRVETDRIHVGSGGLEGTGTVSVTNGAVLNVNSIEAPAANPLVVSGVLEFSTNQPAIGSGAVLLRGGTFSFRDVPEAEIELSNPPLSAASIIGSPTLSLVNSTNRPISSLLVQSGNSATYSQVLLQNGTNRLAIDSLNLGNSGRLLASNTVATISGSVTNFGSIEVVKSTLIFEGPVYLAPGSTLTGSLGRVIFKGPLRLPAQDVYASKGVRISLSEVETQGGKLILDGSGFEMNGGNSVFPAGSVILTNGFITYVDTVDAPLTLPPSPVIGGEAGLSLINSTNAFVDNYVFERGNGGYSRLRLEGGTDRWQSGSLTVGAGADFIITNCNARVDLRDRQFRIENGGAIRESGFGDQLRRL